ncbi:putative disease resistance protein RGA4 isoform X2 [Citrus sinensis]|uniref:putative disease resistance protein RGA4 isoform X2 n=1 Tax=Citrus sinensis TaxID=2711 RepID=UPI00227970CE|nr:putative disease resistance protein RGA4 isoform X2 [Citrus sinensis]
MVDAILSPLLEQLTSMAVDEAKEQVRLETGVGKEAEKLTRKLRTIQTVLHDAEKRQIKEETVRLWLDQLRDACYDMEDVLGEWNTARLKLQIDGVDDHENDALVPKKKLTTMAAEETKEQVRLVTGVGKEVKKLSRNLQAIQAVLHDVEKRQVKEESVRLWLDQLRDVSYNMEDVLEEWSTARLKLKIDGVDDHENAALDPNKKVCSFFPAASCFGCKRLFLRRDIALKLKEINESLDDIAKQKDQFGFAVNVIKSNERAGERIPSVSSIDESEIFGRKDEKNELVDRLICENSIEQKGPHIISLVGMGGIGKTTLAQFAYNNGDVEKNFEKRIWVCVSDPFDEFRIARAIIEALTGCLPNFVEFQSLMQHIQKHVAGKKLLLVLDDVWNENFHKWEQFNNCLKNCLYGSKILITTRKEAVARIMGSTNIISVNVLSGMECWLVFESLAFVGKSMEERENLEKIGREITRKCKGLPLATKTIASLLRSKNTEKEWQNILKSEIWEIEQVEKNLLAPLLLSYNELPSKVKQCFTYCAVFPKDVILKKDKLIELWMAQGFLNNKRNKEMEEIGEEYFNVLASRSFFQEFGRGYDGELFLCKMHDIVHDFAEYLCSNECLIVELHSGEELAMSSFAEKKILHLTLAIGCGPMPIYDNIEALRGLRSLLLESTKHSSVILPQLFDKLTCLRALKLEVHNERLPEDFIKEVPTNIEKLLHLKYLNLANQMEIERLPETLCELYNLEHLNVNCCVKLRELPQGIGRLRKLMYLDNECTVSLRYLPVGIGKLIRLRRVKEFVVGGGYGRACSLGSLKKLNLLRDCRIRGLGDVSDVDEARRAELEKKKNLFELKLHFDQAGRRENEEDEDERLLEALGPPPNLKELWINKYRGKRNVVPKNWIMSLTNLRFLGLHEWRNCEHLPPLGKLPSLESLYIAGMKSVKRVGNEFLGVESDMDGSSVIAFAKLKKLTFYIMEELEEWDLGTAIKGEIIIMPRLSSLTIWSCRKLKALPDHLLQKSTLQKLEIWGGCHILQERYREETGEDWPNIRHIPKISIA